MLLVKNNGFLRGENLTARLQDNWMKCILRIHHFPCNEHLGFPVLLVEVRIDESSSKMKNAGSSMLGPQQLPQTEWERNVFFKFMFPGLLIFLHQFISDF